MHHADCRHCPAIFALSKVWFCAIFRQCDVEAIQFSVSQSEQHAVRLAITSANENGFRFEHDSMSIDEGPSRAPRHNALGDQSLSIHVQTVKEDLKCAVNAILAEHFGDLHRHVVVQKANETVQKPVFHSASHCTSYFG